MKVAEYSGLSGGIDVDATGTGSGTSLTTSSVSTNFANETLFIGAGIKTGGVTFTAGSGFTVELQRSGGSESEAIADKNVTSTGSYAGALTASSSGEWEMILVGLSSSGASTPPSGWVSSSDQPQDRIEIIGY
jgi:hypothetical protein